MTDTATVPDRTGSPDRQEDQPYAYRAPRPVEPDWTRFPGWRDVTDEQWRDVQWQRSHCVKNVRQLRELMGDLLADEFYTDLERDQAERATMSMLVPPQMMNTIAAALLAVASISVRGAAIDLGSVPASRP